MLASISRRRRLVPLGQISVGGGTTNRIHPSKFHLPHLYSLAPVAPNSEPCLTTVSYLVSCGVSPATAAVRRVRIRDTDKADAVRGLFREYGFSDAEVTRTIRNDSVLLTFHPDRILRPKLNFLLHSLHLRPQVIATHSRILARSLDKHLVPCTHFLRDILGTDNNLRVTVARNPRALMVNVDSCMRPAVEALNRLGLSKDSIAKLCLINLGVFLMPIDRIAEIFGDLKDFGMCPTDTNFPYAFRVMCCLSREKWQRKVALYGSFGVSEDVLIRAFKKQPTILVTSEQSIKEKVRFFQDVLKLELSNLIQRPMILLLSLEKCVKPRCAVLSILMREGKLEPMPKLLSSLITNTKAFSKRFVLKHADDVPDVVQAFEGKIKFEGFGDQELELLSS